MQDNGSGSPAGIFIVSLDDFLVARDIEMIIRDLRPDAQVVVARQHDDAVVQTPGARIEAAFVQTDAARVLASPLGQRVLQDGGHIVLVGQERADLHKAMSVLRFPFAQDDIVALLAGVTRT